MSPRAKLLVAFLLVLAAAGSSFAATLIVPSAAHPTIAAAILHANPNDTISISAGEYRENLTIPINKTGLTIVGALGYGGVCPPIPSAIVDGGVAGDIFLVQAERTSFRCLELRHGSGGIRSEADYLTVQQSLFLDNHGNAIFTEGAFAKILYNAITGAANSGIYVNNIEAQIRNNSVKLTENNGIEFYGDRTIVDANTVTLTGWHGIYSDDGNDVKVTNNVVDTTNGTGIYLEANDTATVAANKVSNSRGYGVGVVGDLAIVSTNQIENSIDQGIYVSGDDGAVKTNVVRSAGGRSEDTCIELFGDRARIEGNTASICVGHGIFVEGHDAVVKSNKVDKVNNGVGIEVIDFTSGPTVARVELNTVSLVNQSNGIYVYAADNTGFTVLSNAVTNVPSDGIFLYLSSALIQQNTVAYSGVSYSAGGIALYGSYNTLHQNIATNNVAYGIETYGCANRLTFNVSRSNQDNGIIVGNDTCTDPDVVDHNTTQNNQGEGLSLGTGPANVTFNVSLNNRKTKNALSGDCTSEILGVAPQTFNGNTCSDHSDFHAAQEIN